MISGQQIFADRINWNDRFVENICLYTLMSYVYVYNSNEKKIKKNGKILGGKFFSLASWPMLKRLKWLLSVSRIVFKLNVLSRIKRPHIHFDISSECCILISQDISSQFQFFPFIYLFLPLCMWMCVRAQVTLSLPPNTCNLRWYIEIDVYIMLCIISINIAFCPLHFRIFERNEEKNRNTKYRPKFRYICIQLYMFAVANATHEYLTWWLDGSKF